VLPEPAMGVAGVRQAAEAAQPEFWVAPLLWRFLGRLFPETRAIDVGLTLPTIADQPIDYSGENLWAPWIKVDADTPALISFTSGSTGRPKGIVRTHGLLAEQARCLEPLLRARANEVDIVAFPVFVLALLGLGSTSSLPSWNLRRPREADAATVLGMAAEVKATRLLLPPSICETIADHDFPSSVRTVMTGGGPVFPDLLRKLSKRVPEVIAVYGSTEAEPIAHITASDISDADWRDMDAGKGILAGRPVPEIRVRIVGDEILVTGPHVNKGYLDPAHDVSTKVVDEHGVIWHRTGDAGWIDGSGRLWLLGRIDGHVGNLFPFSVEAAARLWPGVRQVALCADAVQRPVLVIAGDVNDLASLKSRGAKMGIERVIVVDKVPLDRRHGSKTDYTALKKLITAE